tara:strand:+ start:2156 stop:2557 length:402 start_codon:yes stop_codon:yes gene_type:complete
MTRRPLCAQAKKTGFDGIWLADHFLLDEDDVIPVPESWASAVCTGSGYTQRAHGVLSNRQRLPSSGRTREHGGPFGPSQWWQPYWVWAWVGPRMNMRPMESILATLPVVCAASMVSSEGVTESETGFVDACLC